MGHAQFGVVCKNSINPRLPLPWLSLPVLLRRCLFPRRLHQLAEDEVDDFDVENPYRRVCAESRAQSHGERERFSATK